MKCLPLGAAGFCALVLLIIPYSYAFAAEQTAVDGARGPKIIAGDDGVHVLEDLVVERKANLDGVKYESDDTLSVEDSDLYTVFKAINSGLGAAVNFDVFFAYDSVVMNADGQHELEKMGSALSYMQEGSSFELLVHKVASQSSSSRRKELDESRVHEVLSKLRRRYKVNHEISIRYTNSQKRPSAVTKESKRPPQRLSLTLVNLGNI